MRCPTTKGNRIARHPLIIARPSVLARYWFFVLACCDCKDSFVKFDQHLTNGESNWIKEFSTDESCEPPGG